MTSSPEPSDARGAALDAALNSLHQDVLNEPVPPTLLAAGRRLDALQQHHTRQWHVAAMAAGVALAFGLGWMSHGQLQATPDLASSASQAGAAHEFVRQAGYAHAVYLPEKRHPVEVAAAEQEHLVQWLSKRLGRPLKIPQLGAMGFELVGGRLLPSESGARAQFMFQNSTGQRVTLYLGALDKTAGNASAADAALVQFRFDADGPAPSFYWAEQGFGYALSGQVDKATLMALSKLVYSQIN